MNIDALRESVQQQKSAIDQRLAGYREELRIYEARENERKDGLQTVAIKALSLLILSLIHI